MPNAATSVITVETTVSASPKRVWAYWNDPTHIVQWAYASDDWHTPHAENDLRVGGKFNSRMESKDGKYGFDFWGIYDLVEPFSRIAYTMGDGRAVHITTEPMDGGTYVVETFEAESENSIELQREGWQAILNNFKRYVENL